MSGTPTYPAVRGDYGIDAPGVVRNLMLAGFGSVAAGVLARKLPRPVHPVIRKIVSTWGVLAGASCLAMAAWMLWESKVGKIRERDRILDDLDLRGDEMILDVGCGRGLFLIGAAHRLTTGKAIGVDIWQSGDQSGNRREVPLENARIEGVAGRIAVLDGDARRLPFADGSFDVVLSSMVLHNLRGSADRKGAVREVARVLKPGGRVALLDLNAEEYTTVLSEAGLSDVRRSGRRTNIFPLARLVTGTKVIR